MSWQLTPSMNTATAREIDKVEYEIDFIFLDDDGEELTRRIEEVYSDTLSEVVEVAVAMQHRFGADEFDITEVQ